MRLSGPDVRGVLHALVRPERVGWGQLLTDRRLHLALIQDGAGQAIDRGMVLFHGAPRSYTGEDVAELHLHGGPLLVDLTLRACLAAGARLARPGEFTRRAFVLGKLDLLQAEGVMGVINARSEAALRGAQRLLSGELSEILYGLQGALVGVQRWLELSIDFPEEDIPESEPEDIERQLQSLMGTVQTLLRSAEVGDMLRRGISVTLYGRPNVGKSTLLNALCGRDRALVSDIPGTTRDVVEADATLGAFRVTLQDTAGLRDTLDIVEAMGVDRAVECARRADVGVLVLDASRPWEDPSERRALLENADVVVLNKVDLGICEDARALQAQAALPILTLCAHEARGVDGLISAIERQVARVSGEDLSPVMVNHHQREMLGGVMASLRSALAALVAGMAYEAVALEVQHALGGLSEVIGGDAQEAVLDRIFSEFCLGK